jgi:hypothetical protein
MRRPGAREWRLVVAGVNGDVMPGFHVANLALAAAARGLRVRIADVSNLTVNAGCFMALDPHCWAGRPNGRAADVAVFSGVTFARTLDGGGDVLPGSADDTRDRVEVVHAPPWDAGAEHDRAIMLAASRGGSTVVLYLAARDEEPRPWRQFDAASTGILRRAAFVTRAGRSVSGDECAGMFTRWTRALTDPLAVVVRDPDSRLSRQYSEAVSKLLRDTVNDVRPGLTIVST